MIQIVDASETLLIEILELLGSDFVIVTPDYREYHIALQP